jgi:hypothetical protein
METCVDPFHEFSISKGSVAFRSLASAVFVAAGFDLLLHQGHPYFGGLVILLFSITLFFGFRLLIESDAGLVLNETGLVINPKIGLGGSVPWSEVTSLALVQYVSTWYLVVQVAHPDRYKSRGALASMSASSFGSPVRVNTGLLDYPREHQGDVPAARERGSDSVPRSRAAGPPLNLVLGDSNDLGSASLIPTSSGPKDAKPRQRS